MILFDWNRVYKHSNKSARRLLSIIRYITYRPIPQDLKDINYQLSLIDWSGLSYLINPEPLFENRADYWDASIVQYIALASLRNYSDYRTLGKTTLDLYIIEGKEEKIKHNSLLFIKDGQVHFKFEGEDAKEK